MITAALRNYARKQGYAIRRTREIAGIATFVIVDLSTNTAASSTCLAADDVRDELASLVALRDCKPGGNA